MLSEQDEELALEIINRLVPAGYWVQRNTTTERAELRKIRQHNHPEPPLLSKKDLDILLQEKDDANVVLLG